MLLYHFRYLIALTSCSLMLAACSTFQGYPDDPIDNEMTLSALRPYFLPDADKSYYAVNDDASRRRFRDQIVLSRIQAYDIEFNKFARALSGDRNGISVSSDLIVLALNGVGATTGGAATKAALAAASAGVVGAQGSVNKDLFYDRTVPALVTQIQANRTNIKATILNGLAQSDAQYPLGRAYLDLEALSAAGSLQSAISDITQQASTNNNIAQTRLDSLRSSVFTNTTSSQEITKWLYPTTGTIDTKHRFALIAWINKNIGELPFQSFISNPSLENDHQKAISDLHIF